MIVGILANMAAELITRFKDVTPEGHVIELVVWRLPRPVPPATHDYKYRASYSVAGRRVVGFDNERGKGDHSHFDGRELPYDFTTVEQLVEDFIAAVAARRQE
jgi:Family of unknown function (DUF6516)